jgi:hypothetical protein
VGADLASNDLRGEVGPVALQAAQEVRGGIAVRRLQAYIVRLLMPFAAVAR